jgi:2,5-dihydroxypyridine 5,6-dioxygenase
LKQVLMMRGARRLAEVSAQLQPGETVVIATDYDMVSIAQAFAAAAYEMGADPIMIVMPPRDLDSEEPHAAVAAAFKQADVILLPVSKSLSHSAALREAVKGGARALSYTQFTEDSLISGGIQADFKAMAPLCDRVAALLGDAKTARVTSRAGTDITMSLEGRPGNSHKCIVGKGEFSGGINIEANTAPVEGTANGVIVGDGSIPNYGIGVLREPVRYTVRDGRITDIQGGEQAQTIARIMAEQKDPNVYNIAQLAVGLNPFCRVSDNMQESHGAWGTCHFGIGTSASLGGGTQAAMHYDVILRSPTIELDGEAIMRDGELLVEVDSSSPIS